jgi:hypothetical protein
VRVEPFDSLGEQIVALMKIRTDDADDGLTSAIQGLLFQNEYIRLP